MPTQKKSKTEKTVTVEFTKDELAQLTLLVRMGGFHRMREYPSNMAEAANEMTRTTSKLLKRFEKALAKF
jgi:hypothetical protein